MNIEKTRQLKALAYFTIDDLVRILRIARASVHVLCTRYVKNGTFVRLKNNFYVLDQNWGRLTSAELFKLANHLQVPSYISFMTAISHYEMTTQVQRDFFESASLKRSVSMDTRGVVFKYCKLKKEYYSGFVKRHGFFIATPEKALVDALHLRSFGKYEFDMDSIDVRRFDRAKLKKIANVFPEKTRTAVERLCRTW